MQQMNQEQLIRTNLGVGEIKNEVLHKNPFDMAQL